MSLISYLTRSTLPPHLKVSVFCNDTAYYGQRAILEPQRMKSSAICHGFSNYQNSLFTLKENANVSALPLFSDFLIRVVLCSFH